jgi:hypothetical protein
LLSVLQLATYSEGTKAEGIGLFALATANLESLTCRFADNFAQRLLPLSDDALRLLASLAPKTLNIPICKLTDLDLAFLGNIAHQLQVLVDCNNARQFVRNRNQLQKQKTFVTHVQIKQEAPPIPIKQEPSFQVEELRPSQEVVKLEPIDDQYDISQFLVEEEQAVAPVATTTPVLPLRGTKRKAVEPEIVNNVSPVVDRAVKRRLRRTR